MTGRQAFNLIINQIKPVIPIGKNIPVGMGWPTQSELQSLSNGSNGVFAYVSVYDRAPGSNTTRWLREPGAVTLYETELVSTLSSDILPLGGTVTLTLSGNLTANDAAAFVAQLQFASPVGVVVIASATDTLSTLASSLASAINGDPTLSTLMSAVAVGPVVTITSTAPGDVKIFTNTCNQGQADYEIRRLARHAQIIVWTHHPEDRETVGDPIATLLGKLSTYFGVLQPDIHTWLRVVWNSEIYSDDNVLTDLYRRDFFVSLEYGETYSDLVYPVLIAKCLDPVL